MFYLFFILAQPKNFAVSIPSFPELALGWPLLGHL